MIRLENLTLQRGPLRLLEDAELTLHPGQKVGLIGANGAGKSSLFALLRGELTPDAGNCLLPADWRIAHMRQEVETLDRLAVDYVLDGDERLRRVQHDLAAAELAHDGSALARLHAELDSADGYSADARTRRQLQLDLLQHGAFAIAEAAFTQIQQWTGNLVGFAKAEIEG